jgi:hypothetical protein
MGSFPDTHIPPTLMTPIEKYDFYIPLPAEVKENTKHKVPLPAPFLQIKEGDVDRHLSDRVACAIGRANRRG